MTEETSATPDIAFNLLRAEMKEVMLRVSNGTNVHNLATAIQRYIEEGTRVVVSCVGVQTVSQAVKATAVANGKTAPLGYVFLLLPVFHVERTGATQPGGSQVEHTVIRFVIVKHLIGT